jgi:hypothetical protein
MLKRLGTGILSLLLTAAVILGAYLGLVRFFNEAGGRTVEIVIDLNDVKKMAAYEKRPLGPVLDRIRKTGISEIGVFEETLPDAAAIGEVYYAKGSGLSRLHLLPVEKIRPDWTYIYAPEEKVRQRIYTQLKAVLGEKSIHFAGREIMAIDEAEEDLRDLGLGISEAQQKFLTAKGFTIIPRVWHDPRYHLGNLEAKFAGLKNYGQVIFDGDKIIGYPDAIPALAEALKKFHLKYGSIEIVKQGGDSQLRKLMGTDVVRVHSVPKDELEKISKEEALDRFVRAARERGVRVIYLRPFLPPQIDGYPVEYNLAYFEALQAKMAAAGFTQGPSGNSAPLQVKAWQVILLGAGVLAGTVFLLDLFLPLPIGILYLIFLAGWLAAAAAGVSGHLLMAQKGLAWLAAVVFPSYAVIATLSKERKKAAALFYDSILAVINVVAETSLGIFLMIGLLADYRFMSGIEVFPAVKGALVLPVIIVAAYFITKLSGEGGLKERLFRYLETKITLSTAIIGLLVLGALGVLVARSGNFTLPVPGFEKHFRNWLEMLLYVRPRTKEFLVGYPFLFLSAYYYLKGERQWLWLLAAIGVIAPISVFNSFSHIHTPVMISLTRTINGLVLGIVIGLVVVWLADRFAGGAEAKG